VITLLIAAIRTDAPAPVWCVVILIGIATFALAERIGEISGQHPFVPARFERFVRAGGRVLARLFGAAFVVLGGVGFAAAL
jgi:hypothetical protein